MNSPGAVISVSTTYEIYIGGARYLPAREIARTHGYARNYVASLCGCERLHLVFDRR
jgi:hypothetical protein